MLFSSCFTVCAQEARDLDTTPGVQRLKFHHLNSNHLGRERTIRVYLPPGYEQETERYPVIYLHDGQNLFEDSTSFAGEWQVDESLDSLARAKGLKLIAVGIDNGGAHRIHEMNPADHPKYGHAEGDAYLDFLVSEVKPLIDSQYRTRPEPEHTAIFGSSLGGLISHYALLRHPGTFSKAGLFSPSYWFTPSLYDQVKAREEPGPPTRIFMLAGEKEENMVGPATAMYNLMMSGGHSGEIAFRTDPEGIHNESFWRSYFPRAVNWLFTK